MPRRNSMSRRARQSMNNRSRRRRTRSAPSRASARSQQSRRSNRSSQSMRNRSSSASARSTRRRPTTILDTRGINIPTPSVSTSFKKPQLVNPEQLVKGNFYYIKFLGLHRSEQSSTFAGIYDGEGTGEFSSETAKFTNVWRMVPLHMREDYNTWVHLEFDFEFSVGEHEFYAVPSEYSKWVSVQNQLARDSKLKDVMLYNTYLDIFGQAEHSRHLVNDTKEAMHM